MRLSRQAYSALYGAYGAQVERTEKHLTFELLWDVVKRGQSLDARQKQHALQCRDCRDCVQTISAEARQSGHSVPDLLTDSKVPVAASR